MMAMWIDFCMCGFWIKYEYNHRVSSLPLPHPYKPSHTQIDMNELNKPKSSNSSLILKMFFVVKSDIDIAPFSFAPENTHKYNKPTGDKCKSRNCWAEEDLANPDTFERFLNDLHHKVGEDLNLHFKKFIYKGERSGIKRILLQGNFVCFKTK